jgi:hypothetical protein
VNCLLLPTFVYFQFSQQVAVFDKTKELEWEFDGLQ